MNESIVKSNLNRWKDFLHARDLNRMSGLYSKDTIFFPTMQGEFLDHDGVFLYFESFMDQQPTVKIIQDQWEILSDITYLHAGFYNFKIIKNDDVISIQARFTFIWKNINHNKWQIMHHHSSVLPVKES